MLSVAILPVVALVLVSLVAGRYRANRRALAGGIVAALGGTLGVALALLGANLNLSTGVFAVLACIAVAAAVLGSVYAETWLRRRQTSRPDCKP